MIRNFKGTLIITDPCYLAKNNEDWDASGYGVNLETFRCPTSISMETLYGDWFCTTYQGTMPEEDEDNPVNYDSFKELGTFTADAGMVCVVLWEELRHYNPNFMNELQAHPHTATVIPNYSGDVTIAEFDDEKVHVVGTGNIPFFTIQTA